MKIFSERANLRKCFFVCPSNGWLGMRIRRDSRQNRRTRNLSTIPPESHFRCKQTIPWCPNFPSYHEPKSLNIFRTANTKKRYVPPMTLSSSPSYLSSPLSSLGISTATQIIFCLVTHTNKTSRLCLQPHSQLSSFLTTTHPHSQQTHHYYHHTPLHFLSII